jgi:hypothetical protein
MRTPRPLSAPVFGALALAAALSVGSSTSARAAQPEGRPVAVSPGSATGSVIGDACPTFSWGAVPEASSYQLVVYRVGDSEDAEPVLRETFAGSVNGWTPSLDRCLERGGQYAWSVRAVGGGDASVWSSPSLFEVASGPSEAEFEEAVEVVRQYLAEEATSGEGPVGAAGSLSGASATPVGGSAGEAVVSPTPLSVAAGDTGLQVNGSPVVTVATLEGVLCSSPRLELNQQNGLFSSLLVGKTYDSGGDGGNYSNSEDLILEICSTSSLPLQVAFSEFSIEAGFDALWLFDGNGTPDYNCGATTTAPIPAPGQNPLTAGASNASGAFWGTDSPGTKIAATGCLTLLFCSDGSVTGPGWVASIDC